MQPTNTESMTTEERVSEIASILALGLVRTVRSMQSSSRHELLVLSANQNTLQNLRHPTNQPCTYTREGAVLLRSTGEQGWGALITSGDT